MKWLVLVDIDGTLTRGNVDLQIHPGQRDAWRACLERPIRPSLAAARAMSDIAQMADFAVVSGRPDYTAEQTGKWLRRHFDQKPLAVHLCPVGTDPREFKASIWASYRGRYADRICAIDDVPWRGPRHFFRAPTGWPALLGHLRAVSSE